MGRLFAVALLAFALGAGSLSAQAKELVFVTNVNEDYPYLIGNSEQLSSPHPGVSVEIVGMVAREIGVPIRIIRLPWKRALEVDLAGGAVDGAFFASHSKEREAFGAYPTKNGQVDSSRAYSWYSYYFYRQKGSPVDFDGTAVKNLTGPIGVPRGYSIGPELEAKGYAIEETQTPFQGLSKLAIGRIGLVAAPHDNAEYLIDVHPDLAKAIERLPVPISSKAYYLMLSKQFVAKNPELAEKIWTTLAKVSQRELSRLYKEYLSR